MLGGSGGIRGAIQRLIENLTQREDSPEVQREKFELLQRLNHSEEEVVQLALQTLLVRGWHRDGTLKAASLEGVYFGAVDLSEADMRRSNLRQIQLNGANLTGANLAEADLTSANLTGTSLVKANLEGANLHGAFLYESNLSRANLREANLWDVRLGTTNLMEAMIDPEQMIAVNALHNATMPDGDRYDGRFNLPGDVDLAKFLMIDVEDTQSMAVFYGVSVGRYAEGQRWAQDNLPNLRTS
ncbi:MAG: pentapeptide repeat-containing protein [Chloroflexi bacterium]|nr:pentapeptide repeat-containing protein [Chloroflexota bacterium]